MGTKFTIVSFIFLSFCLFIQAQNVTFVTDKTSGCVPLTVTFTDTNKIAYSYIFINVDGQNNIVDSFTAIGNSFDYTFTTAGYFHPFIRGYSNTGNLVGYDGLDIYVYGRYGMIVSADTLCPNEKADFENYNSYDAQNCFWNFGDGDTASGNKVSHFYASAGNYLVSLTIKTYCSRDTILTHPIVVNFSNPAPVPGISFYSTTHLPYPYYNNNINKACSNEPIYLNTGNYANIQSYHWDFGDGNSQITTKNETYHSYALIGSYPVALTIYNNCGNTNSSTKSILIADTISQQVPDPFWASSLLECLGTEIKFSDWQNNSPSILWNFGDGTTNTSRITSHRYSTTGKYPVTFTATNYCGNAASYTDTVIIVDTIYPAPPYFRSFPNEVCPGDKVQFILGWEDGNNTYQWDFGDGITDTARVASHIFKSAGVYLITRTITNGCGNSAVASDSIKITTTAVPPVDFDLLVNSQNVYPNRACPEDVVKFIPYSYSYWFVPPPPFEATSYLWDFGDGVTDSSQYPTHMYADTGNYIITITVTNHCGSVNQAFTNIIIDNTLSPYAWFFWKDSKWQTNSTVKTCENIHFYSAMGLTYRWDWGDGNIITTSSDSIVHSYSKAGSYNVKLTITNGCGNSSSKVQSITATGVCMTEIPLNDNPKSAIRIYPNPLTSSSTLQLSTQLKDVEVTIYDVLGKEMMRKKISGDRMEIERGSLESGVYFVKVSVEEKKFVQKIVVQ